LGVKRATETTTVQGRLRLDFIKYAGDTDRLDDLNNQYAFLDIDRRWERLTASVAGAYARTNTLVNQQRDPVAPDFGLGPVDPDAGITTDQARSDEYRIAPRLSYELSERNSLSGEFRYTNKRYQDVDFTRLTDFQTWRADVGFTRELTETSGVKLTAGILDYDAINEDRTYDTTFVTLAYRRSFTERLRGELTVGWRKTDFDTGLRDGSNTGGVYRLEGTYTTELDRFSGRIGRTIVPSGGGTVAQRDEIALQWNRDLGPKWNFLIRGRYFKDETIESLDANLDLGRNEREWVDVVPTISWQFAEDWALAGSYRYRWRQVESEPSADSNSVFLSLVWVKPAPVDSFLDDWF